MRDKTLYLLAWPSQEDLGRVLLHIPVGLVMGFSYFAHWVFPIVLVYLFWQYEKNEDRHINDGAWKDIKGAIWGAAIVSVVVAILRLTGVI